ncbi:lipocalin family protein [Maribacter polysaccharolyticus]|uniref:lipocalin family protein n=1 Tax=Maribacter polysaccharolyticus TaxID=3020831 RepID=UPI00237F9223|nr:lipocalin family protein [Maribacter polysaccharolyticus]MDE3740541.1 lipocalin family protein [Maribacter polysaccharolyticus]
MKKIIALFGIVALLMSSCSVSKAVRTQRNLLSGTWVLEDVSYKDNTGNFSSILFNDAKDICFEDSTWFFRDNNSTGRYTLSSSSLCNGGDRYIRWSVVDRADGSTAQLQFKFIDADHKDIDGGLGYRLNIASLTPTDMVLESNNRVDGEPITVVYRFAKK